MAIFSFLFVSLPQRHGYYMINIQHLIYEKIKDVISSWNTQNIYAISFFVDYNASVSYKDFYNVRSLAISYNTEDFCNNAGIYDEKRWNYAFWSQNETPIIDVYAQNGLIDMLYKWYAENGIENIGYEDEDEDNDYDNDGNYIGKGPVGYYELLNVITEVALRLQYEGVLKTKFGKPIPIIIHGLEYAWYDIEATKKANPNHEADDFMKYIQKMHLYF